MSSSIRRLSPARQGFAFAFITRSEARVESLVMRHFAPILLSLCGVVLLDAGSLRAQDAPSRPDCLSTSEIRDAMATRKILEPMTAVRNAVRLTHSEPLRSQLCRSKDGLQYELTLLRRDGKVVRVILNAINGALISSRVPPERLKPDHSKPTPAARAKPTSPDHAVTETMERQRPPPADRDKTMHPPETSLADHSKTGALAPGPVGDRPNPPSAASQAVKTAPLVAPAIH
jgi:hypothetical protein